MELCIKLFSSFHFLAVGVLANTKTCSVSMTAERAGTIKPAQPCMSAPWHVDSNNSAETSVCSSFRMRTEGKHETWNTSVATEDLLINDGRDRQAVEAVGEGLPQLDVVSPLTWESKTTIKRSQSNLRTNKTSTAEPIASYQKLDILYNPGSVKGKERGMWLITAAWSCISAWSGAWEWVISVWSFCYD